MSEVVSGAEWPLTADLVAMRDMVRDFIATEIRPRENGLDPDALALADGDLAEVQAKARQAGLWCVATPEEYGGAGLSIFEQAIVAEESARCRMGLEVPAGGAFGFDPPSVVFTGSDEQIKRWALPVVERGLRTFVALTEPSGGADPGRSIRTTASRTDEGWVINGSKTFISGADDSEWGIVFARTGDRTQGRSGLSCFIVDPRRAGFQARPIPVIRSWYPCEVTFQDYVASDDEMLGDEGQGFALAQRWLGHGRVRYAAVVLGVAAEAIAMAASYAQQRETFGSYLADKQGVTFALADCEVELRAARLLVYQAAARGDAGAPFAVDASIAKLYATETAGRIVDRCLQVFGGMGVSKELPLERWYRELRVKRIGEGPSEVHRMVIARDLLGRARGRKS